MAAPLGALAFLAAALIAFTAPQQASASLLSEFGSVDYDTESEKLKKSAMVRTQQQSAVLEDAAAKAKQRVEQKAFELAQKERARELLKKLDAQKRAEEAEKEAREKKLQEKRDKILAELKKKAEAGSGGEASGKAEALFSKFSTETKERQDAETVAAKKQEALRLQVLTDLEKRKAEAQAAADEADAIALRIEALAKTAREAAVLAKKSAATLNAQ